jgi:hypothetical protein
MNSKFVNENNSRERHLPGIKASSADLARDA